MFSGLLTWPSHKILWLVNSWNEVYFLKCSPNLSAFIPVCVWHILACAWKVCSLKCVGCQEYLLLPLCLFFWSRSRWKLPPGKCKAMQIISIWRRFFNFTLDLLQGLDLGNGNEYKNLIFGDEGTWFCGMCIKSLTLGSHPAYLMLLSWHKILIIHK